MSAATRVNPIAENPPPNTATVGINPFALTISELNSVNAAVSAAVAQIGAQSTYGQFNQAVSADLAAAGFTSDQVAAVDKNLPNALNPTGIYQDAKGGNTKAIILAWSSAADQALTTYGQQRQFATPNPITTPVSQVPLVPLQPVEPAAPVATVGTLTAPPGRRTTQPIARFSAPFDVQPISVGTSSAGIPQSVQDLLDNYLGGGNVVTIPTRPFPMPEITSPTANDAALFTIAQSPGLYINGQDFLSNLFGGGLTVNAGAP